MIDARSLPDGESLAADVCIVGAGAAGIPIAMQFIHTPYKVILMESGEANYHHATQQLLKGQSTGREYMELEYTRRKQLGGTTHRWAGRSRPLDDIDFETRDWVPHSGWPINRQHLESYYQKAQDVLDLYDYHYEPAYWERPDAKPLGLTDSGFETIIFQYSRLIDTAYKYLASLQAAQNLTILTYANAVDLLTDGASNQVTSIQGKTLKGNTFSIAARFVILAVGGLETTRLLLSSRGTNPNGLGNGHDLVGRYFMEHIYNWAGIIPKQPDEVPLSFYKVVDHDSDMKKVGVIGALAPTAAMQREEKLLNSSAFFVQRSWDKAQDAYFSLAGMHLQDINERFRRQRSFDPERVARDVYRIGKDLPNVGRHAVNVLKQRLNPRTLVGVRAHYEQTPDPESRVTLSDKRNALGQQQLSMHWRLNHLDQDNFVRFNRKLHALFAQLGLPFRLYNQAQDGDGWPMATSEALHHLGTARMHNDPRFGVVDADCRVHEAHNLFIASSAVFPTGGHTNPTLTIVAIALRVAEQVKKLLG
jgi:choline dehydrogenase-like flavoprotein